jgi:DNA-binding helix-hairpin-helix protein with protein kinase domain
LQLDAPTVLLDSICRPLPIGTQIGRGGEGSVYELQSDPSLVAKVYHKRPLPEDQHAKLQAMVSCWSSPLETIAAWPRSILYDSSSRQPCGILMTRMDDARPLHELYGTTNRRRHFPDVGWHHMVLAARNTAAAFQTLHAANILVGDVNQGNLLVDKQMCVRMIDCDSFQLTSNGRTYSCPVGTPHFTPPELQSQKLREIVRTPNHDRFGLAVLIFHLLFVGRHPFAGRYLGPGDLSIERAIAERRFAFSKNRAETLVDPPPASLLLDDLPGGVGNLFESAFRSQAEASARPTPVQWVQELTALMKFRKTCRFDPIHVYPAHLDDCPWCRIEDRGGPSFFVAAGAATTITADRLAALEYRIMELEEVPFPDLPSQRLAIPPMPALRTVKNPMKLGWPEWNTGLIAATWVACFIGAIAGGMPGGITLAAGAILSITLSVALIVGKRARERRDTHDEHLEWLQKGQQSLTNQAKAIQAQHQKREEAFERSTEDVKNEIKVFRTAHEHLKDAIAAERMTQKAEYLRSFLIRDSVRKIPELTYSQVAMMESFGVESANDLEQMRLYGIPTIEPETVMELLQWRRDVERGFTFNPEHGITLADLGAAKEVAVRRFKIALARKILTAAKQIAMQADVAREEIQHSCGAFDNAVEQWKARSKQFRDFQSRRRHLERFINCSPAFIVGLALGVPFVAWLVYLLVG